MIPQYLIVISLPLVIIGFLNRNDLSADLPKLAELMPEQVQTEIQAPAFAAEANDVLYRIHPRYEYELHGLVVSYRQHDS